MSRFLARVPALLTIVVLALPAFASVLLTIASSAEPTLADPAPTDEAASPSEPDLGTIIGSVRTPDGDPAARLTVDVFHATSDGSPAGYLASTTTTTDGSYKLNAPGHGCYVVIFDTAAGGPSPDGGTAPADGAACIDTAEGVIRVDGSLASHRSGPVGGRVSYEDGVGIEHLSVELFAVSGDGTPGAPLGSTSTDANGLYEFDVAPSCYIVVIVAAGESTFVEGATAGRHDVCTDGSTAVRTLDAIIVGTANPIAILTPIEIEIVRLTNELRARPDGPLARLGPTPDCVAEEFYGIEIDPATGHPMAVPPLVVDERVTVAMARPWAEQMQLDDAFVHRPSDSQRDFYLDLAIPIVAWGENIAWFSGYDSAVAAAIHFDGWRQSDTGHYCSMLTGRFTHLGVGELRQGAESWAVQNFYQER